VEKALTFKGEIAMRKILFITAFVTSMVPLYTMADASTQFLTEFQTKYPNNRAITCGVCHTTRNPVAGANLARNPYGLAFQARPHATPGQRNGALTFIEKLDSDGDGFTNLTEITATTARIKVLPGFARANPAFPRAAGFRPVPPRLLFFDNFSNAFRRTIPNWTVTGAWTGNRVSLLSPAAVAEVFASPNTPAALNNFRTGTISAKVQLVSGNDVDIIWSKSDLPTPGPNFRFVGVSINDITIGQDGIVGGQAFQQEAIFPTLAFANQAVHTLEVRLTATGLATVFVDGARIGSLKFPTAVAGQVGFRTQRNTRARFDDMTVSR
jgi:hypothetical protein